MNDDVVKKKCETKRKQRKTMIKDSFLEVYSSPNRITHSQRMFMSGQ